MRANQNANQSRHSKPYARPGTSTNNGENNEKGILSHMKESVSELLSQSWVPSFLRHDASTSSHDQTSLSHTERESVNNSYVPTASTSNVQSNQIYPEEGNSAGPSTSNTGKHLMAFKLNNVDKYKLSNILRSDSLVSSTPASSPNLLDRGIGIMETPTNASADVSIITPSMIQMDTSDPSTSQTPIPLVGNRSSITKKRLRDTFNESSITSFHNRSLPQTSALSSKRPRFNASTYGTPANTSGALADSSFSIFYPGKTMYGGAANYKKSKCLTPLKTMQRSQVRAQPAPDQSEEEGGLSMAAKRILNCLEKMSTPLSEAKKMPIEKGKVNYFDSPYVSDFHKHRPSLRTDSPRTPPVGNLLTPSQMNTKENLASFLRKQGTPNALGVGIVPNSENRYPINTSNAKTSDNFNYNKRSPIDSIFSVPCAKLNQELDKTPIVKMKTSGVKVTQDSFKITSKKGIPQFDNSPIEIPDLPNIALPVTILPTISFDTTFKPAPPTFDVNCKSIFTPPSYNFKVSPKTSSNTSPFLFSSPVILRESAVKSIDAHDDLPFVFSKPHSEKDISSPSNIGIVKSKSPGTCSMTSNNKISSIFTNGSVSSNWGDKFKPTTDSWECNSCLIRNKNSDAKCVACQTPNSENVETAPVKTSKPAFSLTNDTTKLSSTTDIFTAKTSQPREAEIAPQLNGFGSMFSKKDGQWTCDVCLVDNKKENDSCVACMTPKPGSNNLGLDKNSALTGFGSQFSMPKSDWECDVCLVRNKDNGKKCIACGSLNPSIKNIDPNSEKIATGFTFGVPDQSKGINGNESKTMTNFESVKSGKSDAGNFSFGINASVTQPSSGSFKFGTTASPAKSSSGLFSFGTKTGSEKAANTQFKFGSDSSNTIENGGELSFGSKDSKSVNADFSFGSKSSSVKSSINDFNLTSKSSKSGTSDLKLTSDSSVKPTTSVFNFGSNSSSTKSGTGDTNVVLDANSNQTNKIDFQFGGNAKSSESSSSLFSFGSQLNNSELKLGYTNMAQSKITTIETPKFTNSLPKLAAFESNSIKNADTNITNDIFKKPAPVYNANLSVEASHPSSLKGTEKGAAAAPEKEPLQPNNFSFGTNTVINKSNMFSFNEQPEKSSNGFNFNPKPNEKSSFNSTNSLDMFSNKGAASFGAATPASEKSMFSPKQTLSNNLKRSSSQIDSGAQNMFSFKTSTNALSPAPKLAEVTPVPASTFTFGEANPPTNPPVFCFGQQDTKKSNVFSFGSEAPKDMSFAFGKSNDAFNQSQASFSIGQANGDSSSIPSFGSVVTSNPFNPTASSVGPAKSSRIIKKAVRRTRK